MRHYITNGGHKNVTQLMVSLNYLKIVNVIYVELTDYGREVKSLGGHFAYLAAQKANKDFSNRMTEVEFENLQYEIKINKWLLKTKWLPHVISILAIIVST